MTRLSVNINKIATIRNARGGNIPDVTKAAIDCERFGAEGITVHPRPDGRHILYSDVRDIKDEIAVEFNIEGYPSDAFLDLVMEVKPAQVTLVPDAENVVTSNQGWDTVKNHDLLCGIVRKLQNANIRVSIFVDPDPVMVEFAAKANADRVELYTEPYALHFSLHKEKAIEPYLVAAQKAQSLGLGLNAGHDLNLDNLAFFIEQIPYTNEVSIGHAIVSDALYYGLENTIQLYLRQIK
jgi:pyridoxine 5-phosphate synthase